MGPLQVGKHPFCAPHYCVTVFARQQPLIFMYIKTLATLVSRISKTTCHHNSRRRSRSAASGRKSRLSRQGVSYMTNALRIHSIHHEQRIANHWYFQFPLFLISTSTTEMSPDSSSSSSKPLSSKLRCATKRCEYERGECEALLTTTVPFGKQSSPGPKVSTSHSAKSSNAHFLASFAIRSSRSTSVTSSSNPLSWKYGAIDIRTTLLFSILGLA